MYDMQIRNPVVMMQVKVVLMECLPAREVDRKLSQSDLYAKSYSQHPSDATRKLSQA